MRVPRLPRQGRHLELSVAILLVRTASCCLLLIHSPLDQRGPVARRHRPDRLRKTEPGWGRPGSHRRAEGGGHPGRPADPCV